MIGPSERRDERRNERGGERAVLIVDDDPVSLEALAAALEGEFEVLFATDAGEALAILRTATPDAILLDVVMPGSDGYELCARVKQDARLAEIPVIFLTSLDSRDAEARGLELGAMDYIAKPVNPPVVRLRVRNQVELKCARAELRRLADTDALTGLSNRRRFDETLDIEWQRHSRSGRPLSLLLLDLDHFKAFNDRYGHLVGDDCLRQVGLAIGRTVNRAADLCARYGGEEFGCILPETDGAAARAVAELLRAAVAALAIPHDGSGTASHVTASIGVVTGWPKLGQSPLSLLGLADEQLYAAKHGGRNRVSAWFAGEGVGGLDSAAAGD